MKKKKKETSVLHHHKNNSKWINDLNIKPDTITSLKENIRMKLLGTDLENDVFYMTSRQQQQQQQQQQQITSGTTSSLKASAQPKK